MNDRANHTVVGFDPNKMIKVCCALWSGNDLIEIPDPSYFRDTKHRPENDVVHVKVVDSDGKTTLPAFTVNGSIPKDNYLGSYTTSWTWYPGKRKYYYGNTLWINKGSYAARISWTYTTLGARSSVLSVHFYGLDMVDLQYRTNGRFDAQCIWSPVKVKMTDGKTYTSHRVTTKRYRYDGIGIPNSYLDAFAVVTESWLQFGSDYAEFDNTEETCDRALQIGKQIVEYLRAIRRPYTGFTKKNLPILTLVQFFSELNLQQYLLFHEDDRVFNGLTSVAFGRDLSSYWFNVGIQNSYLDAIKSVPRLNENSISNILEIAGFIKSLVIDHRIELPKSLSSIWLSYRYQYTTSKLDAEEAIEFVHRYMDLGTLDKWMTCYGRHTVEFEGRQVTFRCGLHIRPREISVLSRIWRSLYTYGLTPSFYAIWDMIPYSFIIDWFLPVGKLAGVLDAERMYSDTYYEIENVMFSISYDTLDEVGNSIHAYTRFLSGSPVTLNGFYFFEEDPVSTKVIGYRALDALSLILG
jgi:hypothetical protein